MHQSVFAASDLFLNFRELIFLHNSILVTGAAGFIGHHLVKELVRQGQELVLIDNFSSANRKSIDELAKFADRGRVYRADVRDKKAIYGIVENEKPKACIHLAAKVSVTESIKEPFETIDVNVNGTMVMLEACARNKVETFVFASSAAVYGDKSSFPISEDSSLEPLSPYGASKVAGEILVSTYSKAAKIRNGLSLRFFNVYGEGQNPEYAGVISKFVERFSKGLPPLIYGDGKQTRDFVSVREVVNAIILAAGSKVSGEFNIGTGKPVSIRELAAKLAKEFGMPRLEPVYQKPRNGEIQNSYASIDKASRLLGFLPEIELDRELSGFARHED